LLTLGSNVVDALAFLVDRSHVPLILEQLKGRVHGAGRRRVTADEPLLELLDDLVAVPRLVAQHAQNHELDLPRFEHLLPAAGTTAKPDGTKREPAGPGVEAEQVVEAPGVVAFAHESVSNDRNCYKTTEKIYRRYVATHRTI